jgi:sugar/nucleoside kinase (ribokinase family)
VVKQGSQGALAVSRKEKVFVPGIKVDRVVDTTGAGDCFNAGFLYGFLRGQSLDTCLKYANLCGGLSVTGYGVSQAPSGAQVEGLLDHYEALVAGAPHLIPKQPQIGFISGT